MYTPDVGALTDNHIRTLGTPSERVPRSISAFEDTPHHFVDWLTSWGFPCGPEDFVRRRLYRQYLQDVLAPIRRSGTGGSGTVWIRDRVKDLRLVAGRRDRQVVFVAGSGARYTADSVVLAVGAPPAGQLKAFDIRPGPRMVTDPWKPAALESVPSDDVLVIGTGLSMIDVALYMGHRSSGRRIFARSRTSQMPRVHTALGFSEFPVDLNGAYDSREILHRVRSALVVAETSGHDWRNVVSTLRHSFPVVWNQLPDAEKRRILRHLTRTRDIHRHRMAPAVADQVRGLVAAGGLNVAAGRIVGISTTKSQGREGFEVELRSSHGPEMLRVGALIDCSGPCSSAGPSRSLLDHLIAKGMARPHPSGTGVDVDTHGALVNPIGDAQPMLHTIGWCRRGQLFESTAIPELRRQALEIARRISAEVNPKRTPIATVPHQVAS